MRASARMGRRCGRRRPMRHQDDDEEAVGAVAARAMRPLLAVVFAFALLPMMAQAEDWKTSTPEAQGMSSRDLAGLVTFGTANGMDSLLVERHGNIVAEAYYAPF